MADHSDALPVRTLPERSRVTSRARRSHDDRGMTTAEYAVGTVAAATLAGILIKVFTDPRVQQLLLELLLWLLKHFTGFGL